MIDEDRTEKDCVPEDRGSRASPSPSIEISLAMAADELHVHSFSLTFPYQPIWGDWVFGKKRGAAPRGTIADDGVGSRVIEWLLSQGLPPTPAHYELGYLRETDRNSIAARATDAILMTGARITVAQADHIVSAYHAGDATPSSGEEDPHCIELRHQTLHLAELAADAVHATGQLGRDLDAEMADLGRNGLPVATIVSSMIAKSRSTERRLSAAADKIATLREEVAAAKHDAQIDALTGLANRRGLLGEVDSRRLSDIGALAICDIDRFKAINDRYGHPVGDRVLKAVAGSISESCSPHLVARWGGEEFIVLFDGITIPRAYEVLDAALASLATRIFRVRETDEALGSITFSAGLVSMKDIAFEDAVKAADQLLYEAKSQGRNRITTGLLQAMAA